MFSGSASEPEMFANDDLGHAADSPEAVLKYISVTNSGSMHFPERSATRLDVQRAQSRKWYEATVGIFSEDEDRILTAYLHVRQSLPVASGAREDR